MEAILILSHGEDVSGSNDSSSHPIVPWFFLALASRNKSTTVGVKNEAKRTSGEEIDELAFDMWKEICCMYAVWLEPVEHDEMAPSSSAH